MSDTIRSMVGNKNWYDNYDKAFKKHHCFFCNWEGTDPIKDGDYLTCPECGEYLVEDM